MMDATMIPLSQIIHPLLPNFASLQFLPFHKKLGKFLLQFYGVLFWTFLLYEKKNTYFKDLLRLNVDILLFFSLSVYSYMKCTINLLHIISNAFLYKINHLILIYSYLMRVFNF